MKTLTPVEWANLVNYPADGSGDPWRTGASPTKVQPPVTFGTQGTVPNEKYAAQWENFYKYTNTVNIKDLRTKQVSTFHRSVLNTAANESAMVWHPGHHAWLSLAQTNLYLRDAQGNQYGTQTYGATTGSVIRFRSGQIPTHGIWLAPGLGATEVRRATFASNEASSIRPVIDTPTSGTTLVFGNGNIKDNFGALFVAGTSGGVSSVLYLISAGGAWNVYNLPSSPGAQINDGVFFTDPVDGSFYLMGSSPAGTTLYKYVSPGNWTQIYNSTSKTPSGYLLSPPCYDATTAEWVYHIDSTVTRATDATLTRTRTILYRAPRATPHLLTAVKTIPQLGILQSQDLGNGCAFAVGRTYIAQISIPATAVNYGIYSTTDYGVTWRRAGVDIATGVLADTVVRDSSADGWCINTSAEGIILYTGALSFGVSLTGGDMLSFA